MKKSILFFLIITAVLSFSSCQSKKAAGYTNHIDKAFYKQQDIITFEGDIITIGADYLTINTESFKDFDTVDVKLPRGMKLSFVPYETLHVRVTVKDEMSGNFPPKFIIQHIIPLGDFTPYTDPSNISI